MTPLRIAVAGAGLGGLCLAQGLAGAGLDVTVYERGHSLATRSQGYRIHLDARAGRAIAACVPPPLYSLFAATCGQPSAGMTVLSERLRVLHTEPAGGGDGSDPFAPDSLSTAANRTTLREILSHGLDGRIRFGHEVCGFESGADGVRLDFADGTSADADILVGADGVGSAVRARYLPDAEIVDSGSRCVYGKTLLTEQTLPRLPGPALTGFVAVVGNQVGMAVAPMRFRHPPDRAAAESGLGIELTPARDYLMWAVSAKRERWPAGSEFAGLPSAELHQVALTMISSWHADLRHIVERAEAAECFAVRIQSSKPVAAWPPSRVTVLGDAIHAMSPARGSGANTALRDAALLSREVRVAAAGQQDLVRAVGSYERAMREYGYQAIAASAQAEAATAARRHSLLFWLVSHVPRQRGR